MDEDAAKFFNLLENANLPYIIKRSSESSEGEYHICQKEVMPYKKNN